MFEIHVMLIFERVLFNSFVSVTLVSGLLMFLLFISELSFYLSTEVSGGIVKLLCVEVQFKRFACTLKGNIQGLARLGKYIWCLKIIYIKKIWIIV